MFDSAFVPFLYRSPVDRFVQMLKFHGNLVHGRLLAELLVRSVRESNLELPECLIPVPLASARLKERGFNQAVEISRYLGRGLRLPVEHRLVVRMRPTMAQMTLPARQRVKNVRGAFRLTADPVWSSVAIVDDVMTTGATVNEVALVLRKAGVEHIQVWCVARAG